MTEADAWAIEAFVDAHTAKRRQIARRTAGESAHYHPHLSSVFS